ncbi:hypothetical protein [Priestia taiwanensis]|uniref:Lipoprotein n=1 Tax=Priestia taiwanensis TaxID=1347902 RepID=A0A917ASJ8_9BACI|nr:hypothetical protein [Priestia taiwanensis]MBM7363868.1 hypothetical protein [Priestia taiwanensis]GGE69655.1 hypothetical protein GCM10007140_19610 [Priestia taiwanensis]
MKKLLLLSTAILLTSLLFGCSNEKASGSETKELEKQLEELKMENEALQTSKEFEEKGSVIYTKAIEKIATKLSPTDQKELKALLWSYTFSVNGQLIPKEGTIEINDNKVEVVLSQRDLTVGILPYDSTYSGAVSGEYFEHITAINPKPSNTDMSAGTVVVGSHYIFDNVENGQTITLTITDELKQRVGLDTNTIKIKRK